MGYSHYVAAVLNLFFSCKLSAWDIDFSVGKAVCRLNPMNHRLMVAEVWHNQIGDHNWMTRLLSARIKNTDSESEEPSSWFRLAVRIGTLFGVFSELYRSGEYDGRGVLDVAVAAGDFSGVMAACYARQMGLNIGTVVYACNENTNPWDLLNYGQMRTDAASSQTRGQQPDDPVPPELERMICFALGQEEAVRYSACCAEGKPYSVNPLQMELLRKGFFAAVVGQRRMEGIIPTVLRTSQYLLDPVSALAYGGVQDYRAKTGEVRPTVIIMECSPSLSADVIARSMGLTISALKERFGMD